MRACVARSAMYSDPPCVPILVWISEDGEQRESSGPPLFSYRLSADTTEIWVDLSEQHPYCHARAVAACHGQLPAAVKTE